MTELKPTSELLRIYGVMETESGDIKGLMIATKLPMDLALKILKQAVEMIDDGLGQHLKDMPIKDPADIRLHTER